MGFDIPWPQCFFVAIFGCLMQIGTTCNEGRLQALATTPMQDEGCGFPDISLFAMGVLRLAIIFWVVLPMGFRPNFFKEAPHHTQAPFAAAAGFRDRAAIAAEFTASHTEEYSAVCIRAGILWEYDITWGPDVPPVDMRLLGCGVENCVPAWVVLGYR